jgi:hypothetical protein
MLENAAIDMLMFQDGIGAAKLELETVPLFLQAMRRATDGGKHRLAVIVELFEQTRSPEGDSGAFRAVPASLARIQRQIALAGQYGSADIIAFSVPDYMNASGGEQARALFEAYQRKFLQHSAVLPK